MNKRIIVERHWITNQTVCVLVWLNHQLWGVIMKFPPWCEHPPQILVTYMGKHLLLPTPQVCMFAEALLGLVTTSPAFGLESGWLPTSPHFGTSFYLERVFIVNGRSTKGRAETHTPLQASAWNWHTVTSAYIPLTKTNHLAKPNSRGQRSRLHTPPHSKDEEGRENCG